MEACQKTQTRSIKHTLFSYLKWSSSCYCLRISYFSMFVHQILRCGVFSLATYISSYCHLAQKVDQTYYGIFLCAIYKSETYFHIKKNCGDGRTTLSYLSRKFQIEIFWWATDALYHFYQSGVNITQTSR